MNAEELVDAAFRGDLGSIFEMFLLGADVNAPNERGLTPLHAAIENIQPETVTFLLEAGADPNLEHGGGWTPLYRAVDVETDAASQAELPEPSTVLLQILLAHGADPNRPCSVPAGGYHERTPLQLSRRLQNAAAERVLLAAGARQ